MVRTVLRNASDGGTPCGETTKTASCVLAPCLPKCSLSEWSDTTECTVTCGGGGTKTQKRSVTCATYAGDVEALCGPVTRTVACGAAACDVACVMSAWGPWEACSDCTENAVRTRFRGVVTQASGLGERCGPTVDTQPCGDNACSSQCSYGPWLADSSSSGSCSKPCGGGVRHEVRTATWVGGESGNVTMCGATSRDAACNTQACATECNVSSWVDEGRCSKECGGGMKTQTRTIITQPGGGAAACPPLNQSVPCNTDPCAAECSYGAWTDGVCSKECDDGTGAGQTTSTRTVLCPARTDVSQQCPDRQKTVTCNAQKCTQDCEMGEWSLWGTCLDPCNPTTSTQERTRGVAVQPSGGGKACNTTVDTRTCVGAAASSCDQCVCLGPGACRARARCRVASGS